jgi:hypothetical protein
VTVTAGIVAQEQEREAGAEDVVTGGRHALKP